MHRVQHRVVPIRSARGLLWLDRAVRPYPNPSRFLSGSALPFTKKRKSAASMGAEITFCSPGGFRANAPATPLTAQGVKKKNGPRGCQNEPLSAVYYSNEWPAATLRTYNLEPVIGPREAQRLGPGEHQPPPSRASSTSYWLRPKSSAPQPQPQPQHRTHTLAL